MKVRAQLMNIKDEEAIPAKPDDLECHLAWSIYRELDSGLEICIADIYRNGLGAGMAQAVCNLVLNFLSDKPQEISRDEALKSAAELVTSDREEEYGPPKALFDYVAEQWSSYLGKEIIGTDVVKLLILLKLARLRYNPSHIDSWIDVAGYAGIGAEIATQEGDK